MVIGNDGTVHYALKAFRMQTIVYTCKTPSENWILPEQASIERDIEPECPEGGGYEVWPAIAVGDNGKVYIVWAYTDCSADLAPFVKMAVRETDGSWTHVDIDSDAAIPTGHTKPAMVNVDGTLYIIWTIQGADGPELVLHTIDTSVPEPEEAVEEIIEETAVEEALPETVDETADAVTDTTIPDVSDGGADAADAQQEDIGETKGGCACSLAV